MSGREQAKVDPDIGNVETTSMYELFIGVLTIISIVGVLILYFLRIFFPDSPNISILFGMDSLYCVIFLFDFARNMWRAKSRREFFFWDGALELLGSIPAVPALRLARLGRVVRAYRLVRATGGKGLARQFIERRAEGALYLTALIALLMLSVGSNLALAFENRDPAANIRSGVNAYWWAYVTVTTVGYGDYYPVTTGGRVVGMLLMAIGIGIFGVLTSFMSSIFLEPKKDRREERSAPPEALAIQQLHQEVVALRGELAEVRTMLQSRTGP